ncbi:unnamed protein product [Acanthoscelides obtectus]|nr:unnamed protein product [Acanthoscelides obtectus]CAK1655912.1 hypothetical protein AOBTE_LOCUS19433 [Acanthoscelides obtectus]
MSILDRARMAMENSYGGDGMGDEYMEDEYEEYPPAVPPRGGPGVGARRPAPITPKGYDEYDEDYYAPPPKRALKAPVTAASGRFGDSSSSRPFGGPAKGRAPISGGMARSTGAGRFRSNQY